MPVFFIPAAVGLMDEFDTLRSVLVPFLVTLVVSLVVTMGTTGVVTQFFLRREGKGEKK